MPRTGRALQGGYCYHVINRGNDRKTVFHGPKDFEVFIELMAEANLRQAMRLVAYCLMPNHFHLVLWPTGDEDISRWMHWLLTCHVSRYRRHHELTGHLWQARFKPFPIADDDHLLTVIRYVERNPVRANLVVSADEWRWSSLGNSPETLRIPALDPGPVPRGNNWLEYVNQPLTESELAAVRRSVRRGTPFGSAHWTETTARQLGLEFTLRHPGRPRRTR